jgi:hypothetical protein
MKDFEVRSGRDKDKDKAFVDIDSVTLTRCPQLYALETK